MTDQKPSSWRGAPWETGFDFMRRYVATHGDANISVDYETPEGFRLGRWVNTQRVWRRSGRLSQDRVKRLETLGFVWEPMSIAQRNRERRDEKMIEWLANYVSRRGHADVPTNLTLADGTNVGSWIRLVRRERVTDRLRPDLEEALSALGFDFRPLDSAFAQGLQALREYVRETGSTHVPVTYVTSDGFKLGKWFAATKSKLRSGGLDEVRASKFLEAGVSASHDPREDTWLKHLEAFREYVASKGHPRPPKDYRTGEGLPLGQWLALQRSWNTAGRLRADRRKALDEVHSLWAEPPPARWDRSSAIEALSDAATMAYPLTIDSYSELRIAGLEAPSVAVIYSIFGSWLRACAAAGVEPGKTSVYWNTDHHSDQDVLDFVRTHIDLAEDRASEATYQAWATETGAPPLAEVLNRFSSWSRAVRLVLLDRT